MFRLWDAAKFDHQIVLADIENLGIKVVLPHQWIQHNLKTMLFYSRLVDRKMPSDDNFWAKLSPRH